MNSRPNDQAFEKLDDSDNKEEQCKKRSNSDLKPFTILEPETPNTPLTTLFNDQQQSTEHIKSLPSSYPRKLPPIKPIRTKEPTQPIKLPSISSLNTPNQTGKVPFSRVLDTVLQSPSSNKTETGNSP